MALRSAVILGRCTAGVASLRLFQKPTVSSQFFTRLFWVQKLWVKDSPLAVKKPCVDSAMVHQLFLDPVVWIGLVGGIRQAQDGSILTAFDQVWLCLDHGANWTTAA